MKLLEWFRAKMRHKERDAEIKIEEAKSAKLRAFENIKAVLQIIESPECTEEQLDAATIGAQSIRMTLQKKEETDRVKGGTK